MSPPRTEAPSHTEWKPLTDTSVPIKCANRICNQIIRPGKKCYLYPAQQLVQCETCFTLGRVPFHEPDDAADLWLHGTHGGPPTRCSGTHCGTNGPFRWIQTGELIHTKPTGNGQHDRLCTHCYQFYLGSQM